MSDSMMQPQLPPPSGAGSSPAVQRKAAIDALMRLAADRPWSDIEITDVARESGISLADMRDLFPSKGAILDGFGRIIDRQVIEGTTQDLVGEPARERLFDIFMRRLDAMQPYKKALRRIAYALRGDFASMAALNRSALNSQRYMLAAASIPSEGPLGFAKLQGAAIAFSNVMETWFDDDDPTQAKTMARLDRELTRGERFLERADDFRRLTAPLRAIGQALFDGRNRVRRHDPRYDRPRDETDDPAAAI